MMKKRVFKWISAILVMSISMTIIGILPVSASSATVTHYFQGENGDQIKEPVVYVHEDIIDAEGRKFDGYEYLSSASEITYIYWKTLGAYVEGYSDRTFKPNKGLTRAEASKILYQFIDVQSGNSTLPSDVLSDKWYYEVVSTLFNAGYLKGYPDGTFRPNEAMKRAEFIKLVVLIGGLSGSSKESYTDVPKGHWAYEYISTATANGVITGYSDGTFDPDNVITRAEAVTIINRQYNYTAMDMAISSAVNPFSDVDPTYWAYDDIMIASDSIGRSINGSAVYNYIDESDENGDPFNMMIVCFLSDLAAPYLDGYRCIYADYEHNYYYKEDR